MKSTDIYFDTLSAALDACEERLTQAGATPTPAAANWRADNAMSMVYGSSTSHSVPLATYKGRATRKHFNFTICRLDRGNYELTTYFL